MSALGELQAQHEALAAEKRVLQESIKSMREECTERWVGGGPELVSRRATAADACMCHA